MSETITQDTIDKIIERFYEKLTKEPYYRSMFKERGVDIEVLKERQRTFIARLISEEFSQDGEDKNQVIKRHPFKTTPERAEIWMGHMKETLNEMDITDTIKSRLLGRIQSLMDQIVE
ncbi:truncated hemoglobin [Oceanobacillus senegalensis]|uniref:truncated hemoglobin n=1 Tax=Oceanobacillus senegalensis TaxID=1936063 RepID=UPI0015C4E529|nr:protoglobin domain-containing protein [Oceanobacillus senegalensis]